MLLFVVGALAVATVTGTMIFRDTRPVRDPLLDALFGIAVAAFLTSLVLLVVRHAIEAMGIEQKQRNAGESKPTSATSRKNTFK